MNRRLLGSAAGVLFLALAVAACAPPTSGTPVAEVESVTWHPCDNLPIDEIDALGLNDQQPKRQDSSNPTSLTCFYGSDEPWYEIVVSARQQTLDDIRREPQRLEVIDETRIGGRPTLVSLFLKDSCLVSVAIDPGVLEFMIGYGKGDRTFPEPDGACTQAKKIATELAPYFPEHL